MKIKKGDFLISKDRFAIVEVVDVIEENGIHPRLFRVLVNSHPAVYHHWQLERTCDPMNDESIVELLDKKLRGELEYDDWLATVKKVSLVAF